MKDGCHNHKGYFAKVCGFCDYNAMKKFDQNIARFFLLFGPKRFGSKRKVARA